LPEDVKVYYKEALQAYSAISVREDKAVDIVKSVSGCNAHLVLDPTLLLNKDQWLEVAKPVDNLPDEPFVLIYELSNIPFVKQVAKYISEQTGMPIVRICKNASVEDTEKNIINIIDAGPAEFLYLLNKAGYVVTNSFHGTAFSINFNKQFYTIIPKGKSNNSRQRSILKLMACEDRMLIEDSEMPEIKVYDTKEVSIILQSEREKSMNYLKTAIDGE